MSTTIGIDFSARPAGTAIAELTWSDGRAGVTELQVGATDDEVLDRVQTPGVVIGIDCPFGWPAGFAAFVQEHTNGTLTVPAALPDGWRRNLTLRATDIWVHQQTGVTPLSVAADRIAQAALRLAAIRARMGKPAFPLDGSGGVAEVYPAAALKLWNLPHRSYKRDLREAREQLVAQLLADAPWLSLGEHAPAIAASDDALDAVLCAVVARAVELKRTHLPENAELARAEGWIHLPTVGLPELAPG